MYKPMYDGNHRFRALGLDAANKPQIFQKGLRERMLCNECEQLLANKYETYAAASFYRPALDALKNPIVHITIPGIDYHRFKLFLLSLLWRFGNVQDDTFRLAKLGPELDCLRNLLLQDNPGAWLQYPCLISALRFRGRFYGDFTAGAFSQGTNGRIDWAFVISGFLFHFFVENSPSPALYPLLIRPGGPLEILVEDLENCDSLYEFACEIGTASLARKAMKD